MDKESDSWVDELLEKDMENGTIPDNIAPILPPEYRKEVTKMTLEQRLSNLESRFEALQAAFIQAQRNQIPITAKADTTVSLSQEIKEITPYKETKTAYIDDTTLAFENVPTGNLSVFSPVSEYNVNRDGETVIIDFAPLEEVTEFTIMVQ